MTPGFRISPMSDGDLGTAVEWAAGEGWNPGLEDAQVFRAVDPDGFLMGWLDDQPITAISVVRHTDAFGFLGFYLCHPDHRGQGYGWQTWQAGIAHLGDRTIGLDGVPAQRGNYETSGFVFAHETQRFGGRVTGRAYPGHVPVTEADLGDLLAFDRALNRVARTQYLTRWFRQSRHRQSLVHRVDGVVQSVGTIRACREGYKIGPLYGETGEAALRMVEALAHHVGASQVFLDVPDPNRAGPALVQHLDLTSAFSCARMYRGAPLHRDLQRIFAEASFELG